ncbi:hypothetical protein [Methyloversatilis sp.]|uniref:hypothetical protein n=1 Tax=Methyloversatilis sp. TaxID=2569862 RepID=UPI002732484F|nr:hypothetical protein [Methyloversatilis sp.]MDP2869634.1 hypothetical protein [Methyloversatilis sp.]MDP3454578.1 hypothetical protein [Methyloversatilis sp.]MDP3580212.1 hypothetical protein [Methyloversatilis sp.]
MPSKTMAGRAEMVRRSHRLDPLTRVLLIVVDGRQDFAALFAALGRPAADGLRLLAAAGTLLELGLVTLERRDTDGGRPTRRSLAIARLYLMEAMERALRGDTARIKPALRAVTDEAALHEAIDVCVRALREAGAEGQVDLIRKRCLELLP